MRNVVGVEKEALGKWHGRCVDWVWNLNLLGGCDWQVGTGVFDLDFVVGMEGLQR